MKIASNGGVGNRLRTMIGYAACYNAMGKQLPVFIWKNTKHAPANHGAFLIKGAEIIDADELDDDTVMVPGLIDVRLMFRTHDLGDPDKQTVLGAYDLIDFNDRVKERAGKVYKVALHLRMTDMASKQRLSRFCGWLDRNRGIGPIYLACDDAAVTAQLKQDYDLVNNTDFIRIPSSLRTTSVEDAAVDMLTCVNAEFFVGSLASSYSQMIVWLRTLRGSGDDVLGL